MIAPITYNWTWELTFLSAPEAWMEEEEKENGKQFEPAYNHRNGKHLLGPFGHFSEVAGGADNFSRARADVSDGLNCRG